MIAEIRECDMPKAADGPKWSPQVAFGFKLNRGGTNPPPTDRWKDQLSKEASTRKKNMRRQRAERLSQEGKNPN